MDIPLSNDETLTTINQKSVEITSWIDKWKKLTPR